MIVLNDLHLGRTRTAGATTESNIDFQRFQLSVFGRLVDHGRHVEMPLMILGDWFDKAVVGFHVIEQAVNILWDYPETIYLVAGNHDLHRDTEQLSAFEFACLMLQRRTAGATVVVKEPTPLATDHSVWMVPHLPTQQMFDKALDIVAEAGAKVIFAHCNYDNPFAAEKLHSLNLTPEQASRFNMVILGHEHNRRESQVMTLAGHKTDVYCLGAQLPLTFDEAGIGKYFHKWGGGCLFAEESPGNCFTALVPWESLQDNDYVAPSANFLKVEGRATSDQAADVIQLVAKLRAKSRAFVVSNYVEIDGLPMNTVEDVLDSVSQFVALQVFMGLLPESFKTRIKELLDADHQS